MNMKKPEIGPTETEMRYILEVENEHNVIFTDLMVYLAVLLLRMSTDELQTAIEILKKDTI